MRRSHWLGFLVVVSWVGASPNAMAIRPDGLDCERYPQIPAERCAAWKAENSDGIAARVMGFYKCGEDLNLRAIEAVGGFR